MPESLSRLAHLQRLGLSDNRLTLLPESLGQLKELQELHLSGNRLTLLPESLGQLKELQELQLSRNRLTALPESLGQLDHLQILGLSDNQLTAMPESLGQLAKLQALDLSNNRLTSLPESLGQLEELQRLHLSNNRLTSLPESLGQLKELQRLHLSDNQLTAVPESLGQLEQLQRLDLSNNQLTSLPESLEHLKHLEQLYLHGNDGLRMIPSAILGPTSVDVTARGSIPTNPANLLRYYYRNCAGDRPLNEVRLILLGRGGVGKTSLVNRLVHETFNPDSAKTEGIQITQWLVTIDGESVRLHVWDFGGQEILHATHQFFLTESSLYLVVLSGREGSEDADAEYWLKLVASFGGGSPVLVVLNKINQHRFDLNRSGLRQKYPNIREFVATDCGDPPSGLDELKEKLLGELSRWDARRVPFPARWFAIKERLAGMSERNENFLTFNQFRQVCQEHGEPDGAAQESLAGYLHRLGIALNYKDDPRLRDTHVLNPHWVTGGIYCILQSPVLKKYPGELHEDDLSQILPADKYPRSMHLFLLDLMQKFELCFPFPDNAGQYLVPELLAKEQDPEARQFSPLACLGFEYHYSILPEGLLPRVHRTHALDERGATALAYGGNPQLRRLPSPGHGRRAGQESAGVHLRPDRHRRPAAPAGRYPVGFRTDSRLDQGTQAARDGPRSRTPATRCPVQKVDSPGTARPSYLVGSVRRRTARTRRGRIVERRRSSRIAAPSRRTGHIRLAAAIVLQLCALRTRHSATNWRRT